MLPDALDAVDEVGDLGIRSQPADLAVQLHHVRTGPTGQPTALDRFRRASQQPVHDPVTLEKDVGLDEGEMMNSISKCS